MEKYGSKLNELPAIINMFQRCILLLPEEFQLPYEEICPFAISDGCGYNGSMQTIDRLFSFIVEASIILSFSASRSIDAII